MIPSSIQEIFGTLSVGILAAIIAMAIWWIFVAEKRPFWKWGKHQFSSIVGEGPVLAVLVLMLYGFAVVVENLTDHLTDTQKEYELSSFSFTSMRDAVPMVQTMLLGSEGHYRFETLFRDCHAKTISKCRMRGLGHDYFDLQKPFLAAMTAGSEELRFVQTPESYLKGSAASIFEDSKHSATTFVNKLYYRAKNWAYSQRTYYDELQSIQRQIEYTRSTFLITTWGILFSWIALLFGWVYYRMRVPNSRYPWRTQLQKSLQVSAVLVVIAFFGRMGYAHAEVNFNERALGYFVSHLQLNDIGARPHSYGLLANQWLQTSAEYTALALQTFNLAADAVTKEIRDSAKKDRRQPAVVLDLDETVIDNSKFQSYLLKTGKTYTPQLWAAWMQDGITQADLVPGAAGFIRHVEALKGTVVYISNRPDSPQGRRATIDTLRNLGVDIEGLDQPETLRLLLRNDSSSKEARRRKVAEKYRVVAFVGDVLGDFADVFDPTEGISTIASRRARTLEAEVKWGRYWFVLPNPTYGQWQDLLSESRPIAQLKIWRPSTKDP